MLIKRPPRAGQPGEPGGFLIRPEIGQRLSLTRADSITHVLSAIGGVVIPNDPTSFWTFALTAATASLAIVAFYGLKSVSLSKADMKNRTTRESAQLAIDHCDQMATVLVPALAEIISALTSQKVPLFVRTTKEVSFQSTEEVKKINSAIQWMEGTDLLTRDMALSLMNRMETWSMAFTHDPSLADESVAFDPCSIVFCQMVMLLYPMFLTQRRANPSSGPYQNVVTLFQGWYAKQAKGDLLEQLKRLQEDGTKLPPTIGSGA